MIADLAWHQDADSRYLDAGVQVLELAEGTYELYLRQPPAETRRLLTMLLSNCTFRDGQITPTYHQPFDIIEVMADCVEKNKPAARAGQPVLQEWGG
ncbi:MAG: hypothetical protein EXR98_22565 [Gemmataceae bacterium]|nr:hypothetical protein [Gemmataceae bacterium]